MKLLWQVQLDLLPQVSRRLYHHEKVHIVDPTRTWLPRKCLVLYMVWRPVPMGIDQQQPGIQQYVTRCHGNRSSKHVVWCWGSDILYADAVCRGLNQDLLSPDPERKNATLYTVCRLTKNIKCSERNYIYGPTPIQFCFCRDHIKLYYCSSQLHKLCKILPMSSQNIDRVLTRVDHTGPDLPNYDLFFQNPARCFAIILSYSSHVLVMFNKSILSSYLFWWGVIDC